MSKIYRKLFGKANPSSFCKFYHLDCRDKTDMHQCWAVFFRTNDPNSVYHCGCGGDEERCDFKKVGAECSATS